MVRELKQEGRAEPCLTLTGVTCLRGSDFLPLCTCPPRTTEVLPVYFCLVVSLSLWVVCRVLTPWPGVAPLPLQWKCGVLPLDLQGLPILPLLFLQLHVNFSEQVPLQSWGLTVYTSISFWTWGLVVTLPFCVSDFDLVILWLWISVFFLIKQRCGEGSVVVDFFF